MSRKEIAFKVNLNNLKKQDQHVVDILDVFSHVVCYSFKNNMWEKSNVEGTLFITKRSSDPEYGAVILNRLTPENLIVGFHSDAKLRFTGSFFIYSHTAVGLFGLWFNSNDAVSRMSECLRNIKSRCNNKIDAGTMLLQMINSDSKSEVSFDMDVPPPKFKLSENSGGNSLLPLEELFLSDKISCEEEGTNPLKREDFMQRTTSIEIKHKPPFHSSSSSSMFNSKEVMKYEDEETPKPPRKSLSGMNLLFKEIPSQIMRSKVKKRKESLKQQNESRESLSDMNSFLEESDVYRKNPQLTDSDNQELIINDNYFPPTENHLKSEEVKNILLSSGMEIKKSKESFEEPIAPSTTKKSSFTSQLFKDVPTQILRRKITSSSSAKPLALPVDEDKIDTQKYINDVARKSLSETNEKNTKPQFTDIPTQILRRKLTNSSNNSGMESKPIITSRTWKPMSKLEFVSRITFDDNFQSQLYELYMKKCSE